MKARDYYVPPGIYPVEVVSDWRVTSKPFRFRLYAMKVVLDDKASDRASVLSGVSQAWDPFFSFESYFPLYVNSHHVQS